MPEHRHDDDALTRLRREAALRPDHQVPCRAGPEAWYSKQRAILHAAKLRCLDAPCPLLLLCREAGRENREQYGIWGGETPADRRRVAKGDKTTRRRAAQAGKTTIPTPREDSDDGTIQAAPATA